MNKMDCNIEYENKKVMRGKNQIESKTMHDSNE
jgi:hypothetical protein